MSVLSDLTQMGIIEHVGERPSLLGCAAHVGPGARDYPTSHSQKWYDVRESESAAMNALTGVHAVLRLNAGGNVRGRKRPARSGKALCLVSVLSGMTRRLFPATSMPSWWFI
jgi:hypothetical protein